MVEVSIPVAGTFVTVALFSEGWVVLLEVSVVSVPVALEEVPAGLAIISGHLEIPVLFAVSVLLVGSNRTAVSLCTTAGTSTVAAPMAPRNPFCFSELSSISFFFVSWSVVFGS